ncbi:MAG: dolichyl-diphosphooligosaccharide--protein glycosyltransferase subunit STT3 [Methanobrevibacter sp.]|nr:dolichyl-diphosphooligosaccharide--protein glycosyltransferase subunit STT3 [Methanobrevibacter sp.]
MDKQKIWAVLKVVVFILAIVCLVSLLRFQAAELSAISPDQRGYFQDSNGLPYFTELDSYYNLRMTQDLINNGHFGSMVKPDGTPWDTLSYAPDGRSADYEPLLPYTTALFYRLVNMFLDMDLREVAFYLPAIIAPLAAIPAYIIVRRITNDYGGITAGIIASASPYYFSHSFAGFFDTDVFAVTIPLLIVLFFIESIRSNKFIYRLIFSILTVLTIVLMALSWLGYIFYIGILTLFMIAYLILGFVFKVGLIQPIKKHPNILAWLVNQREIFSIVFVAIFGVIGLTLTRGFDAVINAPFELIGATQIQEAATAATAYPNVYISIAELQIPNILYGGIVGAFTANSGGIINAMGGILPLFGILIILFVLAQRLWALRSYNVGEAAIKKPPKSQRQATSKLKERKDRTSLIESTMGNIKTTDDVYRNKRETLLYLTLFSVWVIICALAMTQGSRFIREFMVPVSLVIGLFVGYATNYVKIKMTDKNKLMAIVIGGALLTIFPIYQTLQIFYPMFKLSSNFVFIIPIAIYLVIIIISALLIYGIKIPKKGFKIGGVSRFGKTAVMIIIMLAIVTPTVFSAYQVSLSIVPSTSDPMWDSMLWVKANTTNDTTLASWWDFGYVFSYAGERPVIFDGGSQTGIRAFWTGKAMTTNDTTLSANIFTMLANSGDRASETLDNYTNDSAKSTEILETTLALSEDEARTTMIETYNMTYAQADEVANMTHPENPIPVIFVASSDMLQKAGWWTYFGNWDFEAKTSQGYQYLVASEPADLVKVNNTASQANITNLNQNGILYQTVVTTGAENNTTDATIATVFENGSKVMTQNNTEYNPFAVYNLIIIEDNIIWKNETVNSTGNYTLLVIGDNGTYTSIIMSKELENAMFTKLFILGGYGQDSYELLNMEPGVSLWQVSGLETRTQEAINAANNNADT